MTFKAKRDALHDICGGMEREELAPVVVSTLRGYGIRTDGRNHVGDFQSLAVVDPDRGIVDNLLACVTLEVLLAEVDHGFPAKTAAFSVLPGSAGPRALIGAIGYRNQAVLNRIERELERAFTHIWLYSDALRLPDCSKPLDVFERLRFLDAIKL